MSPAQRHPTVTEFCEAIRLSDSVTQPTAALLVGSGFAASQKPPASEKAPAARSKGWATAVVASGVAFLGAIAVVNLTSKETESSATTAETTQTAATTDTTAQPTIVKTTIASTIADPPTRPELLTLPLGVVATGFESPSGVLLTPDGKLYVSDYGKNTVYRIDDGRLIAVANVDKPGDLSADTSGRVLIVDGGGLQRVVDLSGAVVAGSGNETFQG